MVSKPTNLLLSAVLFIIVFLAVKPSIVFANQTDWKDPENIGSLYEEPSLWYDSQNAKSEDGTESYSGDHLAYLKANWEFPDLPDDALIDSVVFRVKERTQTSGVNSIDAKEIAYADCTPTPYFYAIARVLSFYNSNLQWHETTQNINIGILHTNSLKSGNYCFTISNGYWPIWVDAIQMKVNYHLPDPVPTPIATPTPTPSPTPAILNVPYFSQNTQPWGQSEYDHVKQLRATGFEATMDRWGCAVTSIAMVLKYHNINQLPDGTTITPGSLNKWLNNNNGYQYGYGPNGDWYSSVVWSAIGTLTKQIYDTHRSDIKLQTQSFASSYPAGNPILDNDIDIGNDISKFPDILLVKNALTNGHYVVAKGKIDNTYAINDPEWNYSDLTSFGNNYSQIVRYIPSHTNLSYIFASVNPDTDMLFTDPEGRRTGKIFNNGVVQAFNEIPNADYTYQPPVSNPNIDGTIENLGTGANIYQLPTPENGNYTITLSSSANTFYTMNVSNFQSDGENILVKDTGTLSANGLNQFKIGYSQDQSATITKSVTFAIAYDDINNLRKQNHIDPTYGLNLYAFLKNAEKFHNMGKDTVAKLQLDLGIKFVNESAETSIDSTAKEILINDLQELKTTL
ncbi:MAG: C39 family peptidase [Candidatus Levyibacteriota bacterium]